MEYIKKRDTPLDDIISLEVTFSLEQGYNPLNSSQPLTISECLTILTHSSTINLDGITYELQPTHAQVKKNGEGKEVIKLISYKKM